MDLGKVLLMKKCGMLSECLTKVSSGHKKLPPISYVKHKNSFSVNDLVEISIMHNRKANIKTLY